VSAVRRSSRALLAITVTLVATKLSALGCDDTGSYIYSGEEYDPVLQCLEPVSSIDVIAGNGAGACGPVCILSLPQDGGQIAYVSTMCPPYPLYPYELDAGDDPLCVAAMQAFARGALCEDGGVVITGDAGTDTGTAPVDAGTDTGTAPVDAGTDTGTAPVDAGVDTGTAPVDAGAE
jgi:hypothetical protein